MLVNMGQLVGWGRYRCLRCASLVELTRPQVMPDCPLCSEEGVSQFVRVDAPLDLSTFESEATGRLQGTA